MRPGPGHPGGLRPGRGRRSPTGQAGTTFWKKLQHARSEPPLARGGATRRPATSSRLRHCDELASRICCKSARNVRGRAGHLLRLGGPVHPPLHPRRRPARLPVPQVGLQAAGTDLGHLPDRRARRQRRRLLHRLRLKGNDLKINKVDLVDIDLRTSSQAAAGSLRARRGSRSSARASRTTRSASSRPPAGRRAPTEPLSADTVDAGWGRPRTPSAACGAAAARACSASPTTTPPTPAGLLRRADPGVDDQVVHGVLGGAADRRPAAGGRPAATERRGRRTTCDRRHDHEQPAGRPGGRLACSTATRRTSLGRAATPGEPDAARRSRRRQAKSRRRLDQRRRRRRPNRPSRRPQAAVATAGRLLARPCSSSRCCSTTTADAQRTARRSARPRPELAAADAGDRESAGCARRSWSAGVELARAAPKRWPATSIRRCRRDLWLGDLPGDGRAAARAGRQPGAGYVTCACYPDPLRRRTCAVRHPGIALTPKPESHP